MTECPYCLLKQKKKVNFRMGYEADLCDRHERKIRRPYRGKRRWKK
jgi:hypothetical protein